MACRVEANGVVLDCACSGCGIAYNHSTGKYHILCCGSITTTSLITPVKDPSHPLRPNDLVIDFAGLTLLQAAQLLETAGVAAVRLPSSLKKLAKPVKLNGTFAPAELTKALKLNRDTKD